MAIFGFKKKKGEELQYSITFADGLNHPPQEFYDAIQKELEARRVPGLQISKTEFSEGGLLSDKRVYLRMIRERLAFDICAAPFGRLYFFSCRTIYIPPVIEPWHIVALVAWLMFMYSLLAMLLGGTYAFIALVTLGFAIAQIFRTTITQELADVDAMLVSIPVLGPIYELWFRKETYFRFDTRMLYLKLIPEIVQNLVDEVTAAKGVKLQRYGSAPILGELYKPIPNHPHGNDATQAGKANS